MASATAERKFSDDISLKRISEHEFTSIRKPERMGNTANIAYGGYTLGVGINAAYQTVKPGYHAYSVMGHYLGPALTDRVYHIKITPLRDTRSFATRAVEVKQDTEKGPQRTCCFFIADFQVQEPETLLEYTTAPQIPWPDVDSCVSVHEQMDALIARGKVDAKVKQIQQVGFGLMNRLFDVRLCSPGVSAQNFYGIAKDLPTSQDRLAIPDKTSADWSRAKHSLRSEGEHVSALVFYMDAALAFIPLTHDHKSLADARTCSSLDFALRIMSNKINMNSWHLREVKTIHGGEGRTYTEGRLWDSDGKMVASMTQQSIMRPHSKPKAAL